MASPIDLDKSYLTPITLTPKSDGWKEVPIKECAELLVKLNDVDPSKIIVDPKYFEQGIPNASPKMYARKKVVNMLLDAAGKLPSGYKIVVWDAWRPLEVQQSLFDDYHDRLKSAEPAISEEDLVRLTQTYVSLPSSNPLMPSPHYTGGAVDVSIIDETGNPLDMGTKFDHFGVEAAAAYFEHPDRSENKGIIINRRLLHNVMLTAGFSAYDEEWWHFDYGNQFDAKRSNKPYAIYGPIHL